MKMLKDLIYDKKETQNNFENLTGVEKVVLMLELLEKDITEQQEKKLITELAKDPTKIKDYKIYLKNQIEDMRQKYESFKNLLETIK